MRFAVATLVALAAFNTKSVAQPGRGGFNPPGGGRQGEDPTDEGVKKSKVQDKAQKLFDEGQKLLGKGDIPRAKSKFKSAIELVGLEGAGQSAFAALENLHQQGEQELERAKSLYEEKKYLDAIDLARMVQRQYANLFGGVKVGGNKPNLAQLAKSLINKIEADPGAKPVLQDVKARPLAKRIVRFEKKAEKDRTILLDVYETCLKASKKFPDCDTGRSCAARAKELKSDKKTWKLISEERERRDILKKLQEIEAYEKAGNTNAAKKALERLLIKYPGKSRTDLESLSKKKLP